MEGISVNLDFTYQLVDAIENWRRHPLITNEDFENIKDNIKNRLKKNLKVVTRCIRREKENNSYLLDLQFGQDIVQFEEYVSDGLTSLRLIDYYGDCFNLLYILNNRPLNLKELFQEKNRKNINRDVANYCDSCGNKL